MGVSQSYGVYDYAQRYQLSSSVTQNKSSQSAFELIMSVADKQQKAATFAESGQSFAPSALKQGKSVPLNGSEKTAGNSDHNTGLKAPAADSKAAIDDSHSATDSSSVESDSGTVVSKVTDTVDAENSADTVKSTDTVKSAETESSESHPVHGDTVDGDNTASGQEAIDSASVKPADLLPSDIAVTAENTQEALESAAVDGDLQQFLSDLERSDLSDKEVLQKVTDFLESKGLDLQQLQQLLTEETGLPAATFQQWLQQPEQLIAGLRQLSSDHNGLNEKLAAYGITPALLDQAAAHLQLRRQNTESYAQVLKSEAEGQSVQNTDQLVSRLLKEQHSETPESLSKDKLFEQLLQQKQGDKSTQMTGFLGGFLKESNDKGNNLNSALVAGSGIEGLLSASAKVSPSAVQSMPQLPVLRGLPGQPGATEALHERIMMMRSKGMQVAEIRLDPPDLGSLEIRVRVNGDSTTVQFHSPNAGVREALESQVQRLREMMDSAGVDLGHVEVSDQSLSRSGADADQWADNSSTSQSGDGAGSDESALETPPGKLQVASGLVDYFA